MRKLRPPVFAALLLASLCACASPLKKKCEGTNWFEYGEGVAKRGQRTSSDSFLLQCEKEEAKVDHSAMSQGFQKGMDEYCSPDFSYHLGKQGEFLSTDLCSGGMEIQMKPRHEQGVREYCQAGNGEAAGVAGKKYNQICPKELETAFVPEFNKGRKKYLTGLISRKEAEISDLDGEVNVLESKKQNTRLDIQRLDWDKSRLQNAAAARTNTTTNSGQTTQDASAQEIQTINSRIQNLQWDNSRLDEQIGTFRERQRVIRQELREAQGELPTL